MPRKSDLSPTMITAIMRTLANKRDNGRYRIGDVPRTTVNALVSRGLAEVSETDYLEYKHDKHGYIRHYYVYMTEQGIEQAREQAGRSEAGRLQNLPGMGLMWSERQEIAAALLPVECAYEVRDYRTDEGGPLTYEEAVSWLADVIYMGKPYTINNGCVVANFDSHMSALRPAVVEGLAEPVEGMAYRTYVGTLREDATDMGEVAATNVRAAIDNALGWPVEVMADGAIQVGYSHFVPVAMPEERPQAPVDKPQGDMVAAIVGEQRTATAEDVVKRLTDTSYEWTAVDAMGWGMGPAQLGIDDAVTVAEALGLVRTELHRGKRMAQIRKQEETTPEVAQAAPTEGHGYTWQDARSVLATALRVGDVFIKPGTGTAYHTAEDGTVRGAGIAVSMPLDGTPWTVVEHLGDHVTAVSLQGDMRDDWIPQGATVLRVAQGAEDTSPVLTREPWRGGQICGWQMSYGTGHASEFCGRVKALGKYMCKEHQEEHGAEATRWAPGNAEGLALVRTVYGWSVFDQYGDQCGPDGDRASLAHDHGFSPRWELEEAEAQH